MPHTVVMIEELELLNRVIYAAAQSSTTLDLTALDRVLDLDESPVRRDVEG